MKKKKSLLKDRRGAVMILIGMTFAMMVGIVATAIDFGRASLLRSDMISAIDSAGLAGGTVANSSTFDATVQKYYSVNLPSGYMGATVDAPVYALTANKAALNISGAAHLKNSMMQVVGWDMANVAASSEVTIERKGMELVLVLDNTGSMEQSAGSGVTKMEALKSASKSLINILYGDKTHIDNLWIGIVPFSQAVNVGTSHTDWVDSATYDWGPAGNGWKGCVEARETNYRDMTDDTPATEIFPKYYSACVAWSSSAKWYNSWFGNSSQSLGGTATPSYSLWTGCSKSGSWSRTSPIDTIISVTSSGTTTKYNYGPNQYCPKAPITPMSSDKQTVLDAIDQMQSNGDTMINLGLVWGWRMLSPKWRNKADGTSWWGVGSEMDTANLPLDYNAPLMNKVIILLTDGDNNILSNNYTAYGALADGNIKLPPSGTGTTSSSTAITRLNTKTSDLCTTLKASDKNVLIYTIALGSSISSTGKTLLQGCATQPEYYFESPDNTELQNAFTVIGDSLSNLRISK